MAISETVITLKKGGRNTDRKRNGRKGYMKLGRATFHRLTTKISRSEMCGTISNPKKASPFIQLEMNK